MVLRGEEDECQLINGLKLKEVEIFCSKLWLDSLASNSLRATARKSV